MDNPMKPRLFAAPTRRGLVLCLAISFSLSGCMARESVVSGKVYEPSHWENVEHCHKVFRVNHCQLYYEEVPEKYWLLLESGQTDYYYPVTKDIYESCEVRDIFISTLPGHCE